MDVRRRTGVGVVGLAGLLALAVAVAYRADADDGASPDPSEVLVVVNGQPVTEGDVQFVLRSRQVPGRLRAGLHDKILQQLVDQRLLQQFLAARGVTADPVELEVKLKAILEALRQQGEDPEQVLRSVGYTVDRLRRELALPLAWQKFIRQTVTPEQLRRYWQQHREEFDGTQVRAAQIFRKARSDAERREAEALLTRVRFDVVDGRLSFADAARKYSQAPSAAQGGDLGYFEYHGPMPPQLVRVAFSLKVGEVSRPFRTPFGVHLLTVTDRRPGQLSLEDVRDQVLKQLGQEVKQGLVKRLRAKARIVWKNATPAPANHSSREARSGRSGGSGL